jgi:hypothetical protein
MEWKKLIPGGFAAGTAPFALHPNDEKRAKEMIHLAVSGGVSLDDVIDECRRYLQSRLASPTGIEKQLKEVMKFALKHGYSGSVNLH